MKSWISVFVLILAVVGAQAQSSRPPMPEVLQNARATTENPYMQAKSELYAKLIVKPNGGRQVVNFRIDEGAEQLVRDGEFSALLKGLKEFRFTSELQALNVLGSHGWVVRSTMVVSTMTGAEHHYLLANSRYQLQPSEPWLSARSAPRPRR